MARSSNSVRIEGGLFPSDFVSRLTSRTAELAGLAPKDYGKQDHAERDEAIQFAFRQTLAAWQRFDAALRTAPKGDTLTGLTRDRFLLPLFEALGYGRLPVAKPKALGDRSYPISHQWMHVPIHLLGVGLDLDRRAEGVRGAARATPHGMVQEYLNAADDALWAIVTNGVTLRLLRDHKSLTRNAYVEFDLDRICADEDYPAFAVLWLLLHSSRAASDNPAGVVWEQWYGQAREQGVRALDRLRDGVQRAIEALGTGFLAHPRNAELRAALQGGSLSTQAYYRLLLRLIYRLLFLFVAEDRDALLQSGDLLDEARQRYHAHYSAARLRQLAAAIRGTQHGDLWQCLRLVMNRLGDKGCPQLALPDLGASFWGAEHLGPLATAELANVDLLAAIRALAYTEEHGALQPVRYRDLGATEFGSVYESLLELRPEQVQAERFTLQTAAGNDRKTTGAYYTPDSLVQCLLDSALDPLIARCKHGPDPEAALLALKVCDPACGSGHFLVAAAHRLAKALAQVRSGDDEPAPAARREAMRDVVARCLYGVDYSEMAVELCKVNLWLEAQAPDLPLAFLDAHIQQGNSLLGATPELLAAGIPDAAMEPLLGDDKEFCKQLKKENKARKQKGATLFDVSGNAAVGRGVAALTKGYLRMEGVVDQTASAVRDKAAAYGAWAASAERRRAELVADAWCAAFVMRKTKDAPPPVTNEVFVRLRDGSGELPAATAAEVKRLGREYRFCHWHVKFPAVFGEGVGKRGFDLVIGNPPWERIKLADKEWFAARVPDIANAPNAAARARMIAALETTAPDLHAEFRRDLRRAEGESKFVRESQRYPLCGRGDVNMYTVFTELARLLTSPQGRTAMIVPTGIATDATTQFFFQALVEGKSLVSLFDFRNKGFFEGIAGAQGNRFCLLTMAGADETVDSARFLFRGVSIDETRNPSRVFRLEDGDFALLNPNTKTCPIFCSQRDAELTKKIYQRVPVLWDEARPDGNPWGLSFSTMFHMSNDSGLFRTAAQCEADGFRLQGNRFVKGQQVMLPLYEAKMVHHYDHRYGDYRLAKATGKEVRQLPDVPLESLQNPNYEPLSRYWVGATEVEDRLRQEARGSASEWSWPHGWLLGWRDITSSLDERTVIASVIPRVAVGDKFLLMMPASVELVSCLIGMLNAFIFDYCARQKVGGTSLKFFTMKQIAGLPPAEFSGHAKWAQGTISDWIRLRVGELVASAKSLAPFAAEVFGQDRTFTFDPARRFQLRCELDAAFFHLYGLSRDEVDYVMDTFPIVRKNDEKEFGEYRTKLTILSLYDQMAR